MDAQIRLTKEEVELLASILNKCREIHVSAEQDLPDLLDSSSESVHHLKGELYSEQLVKASDDTSWFVPDPTDEEGEECLVSLGVDEHGLSLSLSLALEGDGFFRKKKRELYLELSLGLVAHPGEVDEDYARDYPSHVDDSDSDLPFDSSPS